MGFQEEHELWVNGHLKRRKGECLDALKRGHGYGNRLFVEQIWWPLTGHFHGLHPEYEVKDWRGRAYYADFMWKAGAARFVFEIMDYGSHGTDRTKYRLDLNRGLFLQAQECSVYYISLDELKDNPGFILSALRSILAPYLAAESGVRQGAKGGKGAKGMKGGNLTGATTGTWSEGTTGAGGRAGKAFSKLERDLMKTAIRNNRILRPSAAARELELHISTVIKYCRILVTKGKLRGIARGSSKRIVYYEYVGSLQSPDLV